MAEGGSGPPVRERDDRLRRWASSPFFAIGVPWLKISTGMDWATAIHDGFTIFIIGGMIKAALGGVLAPAAWKLVKRIEGSAGGG